MEWYLKVVRDNYSNFTGRARRKEYWMFFLFNMIFTFAAMIVDNILGTDFTIGEEYGGNGLGYGWIYVIYMLAVWVPGIAVTVRRLHDVGKSGWFVFIMLIPLIGPIWYLVLMCTDGDKTENTYGPSPKGFGSKDRVEEE